MVFKTFLEEVVSGTFEFVCDRGNAFYGSVSATFKQFCNVVEFFRTFHKEIVFLPVLFKEHNNTAVIYFEVFDFV